MSGHQVRISAPASVLAGETFQVDIEVECKTPTDVDYIDAEVFGHQTWLVRTGNIHGMSNHRSASDDVPALRARVGGRGVLPAGVTRLSAMFALPPETAPTHQLWPAQASLEVVVTVSTPRWLDEHYRLDIPVRRPPPFQVARTPGAFCSPLRYADEPRLEVSLASTRLVAGEIVTGSLAVFHVDNDEGHQVTLRLVPVAELYGHGREYGVSTDFVFGVPRGGAGTTIPFGLQVPPDLLPSFAGYNHGVSWVLVAEVGILFHRIRCEVPLEVVAPAASAVVERLPPAPGLSNERIAGVMRAFAQAHGWGTSYEARTHAMGVEKDGEHGHLSIALEHRGEKGSFLVSRLVPAPLGLELDVRSKKASRRDAPGEVAEWGLCAVRARSITQAWPVIEAVMPVVVGSTVLGTLDDWTESGLVFDKARADFELPELIAMAQQLEYVARALANAHSYLFPPANLTVDLGAWRELAREWRAPFAEGDLSIQGVIGADVPMRVGLKFDAKGTPTSLEASVGSRHHARGNHTGVVSSSLPVTAANLQANRVRALVMELHASIVPDGGPYR